MKNEERLEKIAEIILDVRNRCCAEEGSVTPILQEMKYNEIAYIYKLADERNSEPPLLESVLPIKEHRVLSKEEDFIREAINAARKIQTVLWGESNGSWGLEEWRRMFVKRFNKIYAIDPKNPHAIVELKKRLMQNAALSIALMAILHFGRPMDIENDRIPSNLPDFDKYE